MKRAIRQDFRLLTSPWRAEPDFILAGEAKCGTTSLYKRLTDNVQVLSADVKEPNNFIEYPNSMARCRQHFPLESTRRWSSVFRGGRVITGDASVEYFSKRRVPETIHRYLPDARIVVLLRDPAARALSDYQMLANAGKLAGSFGEIVDTSIEILQNPRYRTIAEDAAQLEHSTMRVVARGLYASNLRRWFDTFGRNKVCVVFSELLFREDDDAEYTRLCEFLEIGVNMGTSFPRLKKGNYERAGSEAVVERLKQFYRRPNGELEKMIDRPVPW